MKNGKKEVKNNVKPHVPWGVYFVVAVIIGGIGGFIMSTHTHYYDRDVYLVGVIIFCASIIFDILALKSLITEAHVKALEVFYGKERAVSATSNDLYE